MSKTANFRKMMEAVDVDGIIQLYTQSYYNKYYDLFCSRFSIEGFDYRYTKTYRSLLFSKGSMWIRKNGITGDPICCDYAGAMWDWNNLPVTATLVVKNNAPETIIPRAPQTVDRDGVIVWARPGEKGFQGDVEYYIGKLAEAETLITINLAVQRAPWILASDSSNYSKLKLLLRQIMSGQPAIITDIDKNDLDALTLPSPWLVDKLTEYEERLENKLKTLLGLDNQGGYLNREQQNIDTTNSNNDEINASQDAFIETLEDGIDRANKVLGLSLRVVSKMPTALQEGASKGLGLQHESEGKEDDGNE